MLLNFNAISKFPIIHDNILKKVENFSIKNVSPILYMSINPHIYLFIAKIIFLYMLKVEIIHFAIYNKYSY